KAGGAYVPLDPGYPPERINYMLGETGASIVISSKASSSKLISKAGISIIEVDKEKEAISNESVTNLQGSVATNRLADVIYTSGSTCTPKGVMIEHGSVVSLVKGVEYVSLSSH